MKQKNTTICFKKHVRFRRSDAPVSRERASALFSLILRKLKAIPSPKRTDA